MSFAYRIPVTITHGVPYIVDIQTAEASSLFVSAKVDSGAASTFGMRFFKCPVDPAVCAAEDVGMQTGQIAKGATQGVNAPYVGYGVLRVRLDDGGANSSGVLEIVGR